MKKRHSGIILLLIGMLTAGLIAAHAQDLNKWERSSGRHSLDQGGETCADAFLIPDVPFLDNGLTGFSDDCPGPPFLDVFYEFIAPRDGDYVADLCGSDGDLALTAWLGDCCFSGLPIPAEAVCSDLIHPMLPLTLNAGDVVYFEIGTPDLSSPPSTYVFSLSGPPPGVPVLVITPTELTFPPVHIGDWSDLFITVTNLGNGELHMTVLPPTGDFFQMEITELSVPPGGVSSIPVHFEPGFECGTVDRWAVITSNDPANPFGQIHMTGEGCRTVQPVPPPALHSAGSPNAIYWSMPLDDNSPTTEYAVEFSSDNFGTSKYVQLYGGPGSDPFWSSAAFWAQEGNGAITGLAPGTDYQVRLHARDCTGLELVGPPAVMTTPESADMEADPFHLVIQANPSGGVDLNWNPPSDINGRELEVQDYTVHIGSSVGEETSSVIVDGSQTHVYLPTDNETEFYAVTAELTGNFAEPSAFIAWPPDGAHLAGHNMVVIQDYLHQNSWDQFEIYVGALLVGTDQDNAWGESGTRGVSVDFGQFDTGPIVITALITYHNGETYSTSINAVVETLPHAEFTATYDDISGTATATVANYVPPSSGDIYGYLWETSDVGGGDGTTMSFQWPSDPSIEVVLVHCTPVPTVKMLTDEPNWYLSDVEPAGIVPIISGPIVPLTGMHCCCDNLELRTSGTANGVYGNVHNAALGPIVRCDMATRDYHIAYAFEVEATIKWSVGIGWVACYWGQDCKRTSITDYGSCSATHAFVAHDPAIADTSYKMYGGNNYPRDGASWGNDDYRFDWHFKTLDMTHLIDGKIRWYDAPGVRGTRPSGWALRDRRDAIFLARDTPQCEPVNIICCRTWELQWDVTICPNCIVTQTIPPTIFNEETPLDCPDLAPN